VSDAQEAALVQEGVLPPDDFHEDVERIREVANYELEIPDPLGDSVADATGTLLLDNQTVADAAVALTAGHLILQGPPGTGKSSLARALARAFHSTILNVTAHGDWSTFEVIGRQELRVDPEGNEEIVPVNGAFTEAAIRCAGQIVKHFDDPAEPQATWLLIDELNRAQADRAFGELFSILGTDEDVPVNLAFQRSGNRELVTPRRFRIIGTINSIDRQFVNSLGQGLKRRFTFVWVGIPPRRRAGEQWGVLTDDPSPSLAAREVLVAIESATRRIAQRVAGTDVDPTTLVDNLSQVALGANLALTSALFDLIEAVRYAELDSGTPFVPIGTAQVIDTLELFISRVQFLGGSASSAMDWAAAAKLAPLFDSDAVSPASLLAFAGGLRAPFDGVFRRELREIAIAGGGFVAE
jgi:MoxR-like ATPase